MSKARRTGVARLTGTAAVSVHASSIAGGAQRDPEGRSREPRRRCYGHRRGISLPKAPYQNAARMFRGGRRGRPKRPGAAIRPGWPPERGGWALSGALSPGKTNRKVIVREQKRL